MFKRRFHSVFMIVAVLASIGAPLAARKAHDARVRDFAASVERSSTSLDATLSAIAKRNDVKPPGTLSVRASDQYSRVDAQSGKSAEQEYLADVAIDARISSDDYAEEARSGDDAALRKIAAGRAAELERTARAADALSVVLR
ncbi:MAG: DUF4142 domain-containing protein [Candidatus Eremiobacteraeota bacterium]|nr:DUF4142 domain-containing protein [Candidatus Eremiobacteraeota bacterium]